MDKVSETVKGVKTSMAFFSRRNTIRCSALSTTMTENLFSEFSQSEVVSLRSTVTEQSAQISDLQSDLNDSDQYSRLPNFEIHGLLVRPNENIQVFFNELAAKLLLAAFQPSEVLTLH